jgi:hypothetical protein
MIGPAAIVATSKLPGPRQESQQSHINGGKKNSLKDLKKKLASNGKLRSTTLYVLVGPLGAPHKYHCQLHT